MKSITCRELNELCSGSQSVDVIDVRTPVEFREVHSTFARNVPLDSLDPLSVMSARGDASDKPLYVICRSGNRSMKACEAFAAAGFENIVNVEGGTKAWDEAGYSVARGKKAMSLERQVRIAAGLLVLTGVVLSELVHPYLIGISAFVGAGLVFAGITDTCGMGMLLAKMPWNQVKDSCPAAPAKDTQMSGGSCCG
ncbi:MAG: rhodanese-like domain-containing protein [Planctomycetota bacterium]